MYIDSDTLYIHDTDYYARHHSLSRIHPCPLRVQPERPDRIEYRGCEVCERWRGGKWERVEADEGLLRGLQGQSKHGEEESKPKSDEHEDEQDDDDDDESVKERKKVHSLILFFSFIFPLRSTPTPRFIASSSYLPKTSS